MPNGNAQTLFAAVSRLFLELGPILILMFTDIDDNCPGTLMWLEDLSPCKRSCSNFDRMDPSKCQGTPYTGCGCPPDMVLGEVLLTSFF